MSDPGDYLMRALVFAATLLAATPALAASYAVVNGGGMVVNAIQWDGASPYAPPTGDTVVPLTGAAGIGWSYASGAYTAPAVPALQVCAITSTGTPALSGNYAPPDPTQQQQISSITLYTQVNPGKFPGGTASFPWPDSTGASRTFTASAEWLSFASAMADCTLAYLSGQAAFSETIP